MEWFDILGMIGLTVAVVDIGLKVDWWNKFILLVLLLGFILFSHALGKGAKQNKDTQVVIKLLIDKCKKQTEVIKLLEHIKFKVGE
jgi:hypothetical protein